MVQARYDDARRACGQLAAQASRPIAVACVAAVDGVTGRAERASAALREALVQAGADVSAPERLWVLTRLAEIDERRGDAAGAEDAFRRALALGIPDFYVQAAYADFLLDRGRAREVLELLKGKERSDLLLLRLAIAAKAAGAPQLGGHVQALADRFDAARRRGDTVHRKEEARFTLALLGQPQRALELAQADWAVQREPSDARVLLEAALAAQAPQAATPVLQWMQRSGIESVALRGLAQRLAGTR
jgi:predicted Zn-dependent protease